MSGKHLLNLVDDAVDESLKGLVFTYPQLELNELERVVFKSGWSTSNNKVSIISGGGSGHEPFPAGFVGDGMLTASVSGSIYAAPPTSHILQTIKCLGRASQAGCLVIIPNYTGDCLNFGLAIEKARSSGLKVNQVIVGEDCSIPDDELGIAGKRALPGILLVIKIAGAFAQMGRNLEEVTNWAQSVASRIASCSIGLTPCIVPGRGPMFTLPNDEVEFGQGLHGEAGYKRIKLQKARFMVGLMLDTIIKTLQLQEQDKVIVLINNFGGLSQLEQGIVTKEVVEQLREKNIQPVRIYSGTLMSSLDSAGVHVTCLKLAAADDSFIIEALDQTTNAPKWPGGSLSIPSTREPIKKSLEVDQKESKCLLGPALNKKQTELMKICLNKACGEIIHEERTINDLDRACGDNDCGSTLKRLANGISSSIDQLSLSHPATLLTEIASIAENRMGGTSGALYGLMFTTASASIKKQILKNNNWLQIWMEAWSAGIEGIKNYSAARLGDKTMIDVLEPTLQDLKSNFANDAVLSIVAKAAEKHAEATKYLIPRAGRASYVKQLKYLKDMDAGAFGASVWIKAIATAMIDLSL
ncbi:triokinase/FMN cyclase-like [Trichogramma pretiosum]|uniref:triokinase/FMN cyclase-like n=1 Tax=Trichogramma pretiosum TaxID=7493 RepID=UPI0006C9CD5B|nr:triokinase/FMN cyclase-like [Trichogramma pretiosum]